MNSTEIRKTHQKLRDILQKYGNKEFGDCIVDEICLTFNYPITTDVEVDFEHVQEWCYEHDVQWQNDMEDSFYNSDNEEGAKNHISWAYMQYHKDILINY